MLSVKRNYLWVNEERQRLDSLVAKLDEATELDWGASAAAATAIEAERGNHEY